MLPIQQLQELIQGKKVAFIGAGVSHKRCIEQFVELGAQVTLCDQKKSLDDFGDYADTLRRLKVNLSLGEHYTDGFAGQDIIMRTPGYEYYKPALQAALKAGAMVTSEVELFFEFCPCEIVAVTGSDGKTTTTTLIAKMFEAAGRKVFLGGNIGAALLPQLPDVTPADIAVVELSSFQLISMRKSPKVAVVTNVTPNHLDHHKDMQEYIDGATKGDSLVVKFYDGTSDHTYTASKKWNENGGDFWGDVKAMCRMLSARGLPAKDLILGTDVADYILTDERTRQLLDKNSGIIVGEIRRYLRDNSAIRVSRSMRDTAYRVLQAREHLMAENQKEPTVEEIAKVLDIPREEVVFAMDAIVDPVSLYEPIYDSGGDAICVMDQVSDTKNTDERWTERIALKDAMKLLDPRERRILSLRFYEGKTQMEVSAEVGISQAQVSRLEKGAINTIRKHL